MGVTVIQWNFFLKSVNTLQSKKNILLTFDDGPHPHYTPQILNLLDIYKVKAIFFVIGEQAEKYPYLLKEIVDKGHIIGNHSYSHAKAFDLFSMGQLLADVQKANKAIKSCGITTPKYFRPPFGITNPRIAKLVKESGMKSVGWSFRSFDTTKQTNTKIIQRIKSQVKGGDILLFHDRVERTIEILEIALPWLIERFDLSSNKL